MKHQVIYIKERLKFEVWLNNFNESIKDYVNDKEASDFVNIKYDDDFVNIK